MSTEEWLGSLVIRELKEELDKRCVHAMRRDLNELASWLFWTEISRFIFCNFSCKSVYYFFHCRRHRKPARSATRHSAQSDKYRHTRLPGMFHREFHVSIQESILIFQLLNLAGWISPSWGWIWFLAFVFVAQWFENYRKKQANFVE
jgi:hypothetical protein